MELPEKLLTLVGYDCEVCHGAFIIETKNKIQHICNGTLIPIYEVENNDHSNLRTAYV